MNTKKKCVELAESIGEFSYINKDEQVQITHFFDNNLREFKD